MIRLEHIREYQFCKNYRKFRKHLEEFMTESDAVSRVIGRLYSWERFSPDKADISNIDKIMQEVFKNINIPNERILAIYSMMIEFYHNVYRKDKRKVILSDITLVHKTEFFDLLYYIPVLFEEEHGYNIFWPSTGDYLLRATKDIVINAVPTLLNLDTGIQEFYSMEIYDLVKKVGDTVIYDPKNDKSIIDLIEFLGYGITNNIYGPNINPYCLECPYRNDCVFGE